MRLPQTVAFLRLEQILPLREIPTAYPLGSTLGLRSSYSNPSCQNLLEALSTAPRVRLYMGVHHWHSR